MRFVLAIAAILLLVSQSMEAKEKKRDDSADRIFERSRRLIPEDWRARKKNGADRGVLYSEGDATISITQYGREGSRHRSSKAFIEKTGRRGKKLDKTGVVEVSGKRAARYLRRYKISVHEEEGPSEFSDWFYEEFVILKRKKSFWVFQLKETSPGYPKAAKNGKLWNSLLSRFKPPY